MLSVALCVAVARNIFKWVKNKKDNVAGKGLTVGYMIQIVYDKGVLQLVSEYGGSTWLFENKDNICIQISEIRFHDCVNSVVKYFIKEVRLKSWRALKLANYSSWVL